MNYLISQFEATGASVFKMSLEASLLILAVLVVQRLLNGRLSARLRYSLWILVWIKLSLPWLPGSMTSVYGL